jgi:hypothetical protein
VADFPRGEGPVSEGQRLRCVRDLAMFNPAIDGKLRACDLTKLRRLRRTAHRESGDDALEMAEKMEV